MAKKFLDDDGFLHKKRPKFIAKTTNLKRSVKQHVYFTDQELHTAKGNVLVFDIECYPNYFLVAFQDYVSKKIVTFDLFPGREVFDYHKLLWVMHNFCVVGFNSSRYDIPMVWLALSGATLDDLQEATIKLIKHNVWAKELQAEYHYRIGHTNHIDLIDVAPLKGSLKAYAGRLHAPRLQDLPYAPQTHLTEEQAEDVKVYCINDLECTALLLKNLEPQLTLRNTMSDEYAIDLRSKSDAQIAETVICSEVAKLNGHWPKRPKVMAGSSFKYKVPNFVSYETPVLQKMLETVRNADFIIQDNGHVQMPNELDKYAVKIGSTVYRMGIGGLHSSEECSYYKSNGDIMLLDIDAASFYPMTILNQDLYPNHMGPNFNIVYRTIVERRLEAKKIKNKVVANSLKIVINASFGKFANKWSNLYSPDLMLQITMSGQLCLLLLIEMIELSGIPVVSGNTDGIVMQCPHNGYSDLKAIVSKWEDKTDYETEETRYKALYSRDVNNYLAIKEKGIKRKGTYKKADISKNPTNEICSDAVVALLENKIPLEQTIKTCKDITKFVTTRNVKGGAFKEGIYLGKLVRFYYAAKEQGTINYIMSGNKVPKSDGAKPLMDLPEKFPDDIDYERYIAESIDMLYDIGYLCKPTQRTFFNSA